MKVTFRLPSKAVQYGYAEMTFDAAEDIDAEELGQEYARQTKRFWEGEKALKPKAPDSNAVKQFEEQLGATKISEEKNEDSTTPPWKAEPEAPATKPWQGKPDLFG